MNVQETAADLRGESTESILPLLKKYIPGLTAAILSALMNRAPLPGGYFPLGAGFMAAVPQNYAAAAAVGGVISCLTDGGTFASMDGLRHVSVLLAVSGIRWALSELRSINRARFYPFFAAFAGVLMTNTVINGATGSVISYSTLYFVIEGIMSGLSAMFFSGACGAAERFGSGESLSRIASVSLIITLGAAAIPLCRLRLFGVSPGMIILHAAVLLVATARRETGGAAAGISAGCVSSIAGYSILDGAVIPFAALLAGYAAFFGRIFAASAYISCCFMGCLTAGRLDYILVAEAAAGGIISCLIPSVYAERALAAAGFGSSHQLHDVSGYGCAERLSEAADAIDGICSVLRRVSDGLEKRTLPDDDSIYSRAFSEVCGKCTLCGRCFGESGGTGHLAEKLKKGRSVSGGEISEALGKKCIHEDELAGEINRGYGYFLASRNAFGRISNIRSVINGQLEGIGMMLDRLGGELESEEPDDYSSRKTAEYLTACGYDIFRCSCGTRANGRKTAALTVRCRDDKGEADEIAQCAGECSEADFEVEKAENSGDILEISLAQKKKFSLECKTAQHCCNGERLCGDSCECFEDGRGTGYILLSDGMGSGGRAAVEGALTCELFRRLLGGGFDFDSAVKIVNSALMIKSEDETLSTADCLRVNLYDGRTVISKAGAAQSYHVRNGFVTRIDLPSLPLGILCETDTAEYTFTAEKGDMIVMISDGVPTDDSMWFENMLKSRGNQSAGDFAELLLKNAVSRRPDGDDDDITVTVGTIK